MFSTDRSLRLAAVLVGALGLASLASAGPPLICHPFTTGTGAPLLPWAEGKQWHQPDPGYDRANLVADTLRLLSADAPILDRMENMRRAAIYADENPRTAAALLTAVVERTKTKPAVDLSSRRTALSMTRPATTASSALMSRSNS